MLDGVNYTYMVANVFPGGEAASVLSEHLLNLESPLGNAGYTPKFIHLYIYKRQDMSRMRCQFYTVA